MRVCFCEKEDTFPETEKEKERGRDKQVRNG